MDSARLLIRDQGVARNAELAETKERPHTITVDVQHAPLGLSRRHRAGHLLSAAPAQRANGTLGARPNQRVWFSTPTSTEFV